MNSSDRIHGFDALRAFALLLGILIHAAMPFLHPAVQIWPVVESDRSVLYTVFVIGVHAFRLQTFFLLAGFFSALLIHKRGIKSFLKNRLQRIVIPFACCIVLIVPFLQMMMLAGYSGRAEAGFIQIDSLIVDNRAYHSTISEFFLTGKFISEIIFFHFWFLYYLIIVYVAFVLAYFATAKSKIAFRMQLLLSPCLQSRFAIFGLAAVSMLTLFPMHLWQVDTPYTVLPDHWILTYYSIFFLYGVWLYQSSKKIDQLKRTTWWHLGAAAILLPIAIYFQTLGPNPELRPYNESLELPAEYIYCLYSWCMVFGLLGGFARWLEKPNRFVRQVSDEAYWQYIMHLPLIFGLQLILIRIDLPGLVEVALQAIYVFFVLHFSYLLFVKNTWLGRVLNGPKKMSL
ncbi:acyltransferase family protein [bacterium]|jgi:hypothetical protein|nr:acyltransferase family protein [bacterium]